MARIEGTITSGKLGDVIYSSWNGRPYKRRRPEKVANPRTEAQQAHRNAFAEVSKLASDLKAAHLIGLNRQAGRWKLNTHCAFKKLNKDCYGPDGVRYARVVVSNGPVSPAYLNSAQVDDYNMLRVTFSNQSGSPDDSFFVFVYCPALREGGLLPPVPRSAGESSIQLPAEWPSHPLHLYAFLRDRKGRTSNTTYLGIDGRG